MRGPFQHTQEQYTDNLTSLQGLGKTVESIALMLQRPRPELDRSSAPGGSACTAGTLIVTPPSISKQWAREVSLWGRHGLTSGQELAGTASGLGAADAPMR